SPRWTWSRRGAIAGPPRWRQCAGASQRLVLATPGPLFHLPYSGLLSVSRRGLSLPEYLPHFGECDIGDLEGLLNVVGGMGRREEPVVAGMEVYAPLYCFAGEHHRLLKIGVVGKGEKRH